MHNLLKVVCQPKKKQNKIAEIRIINAITKFEKKNKQKKIFMNVWINWKRAENVIQSHCTRAEAVKTASIWCTGRLSTRTETT